MKQIPKQLRECGQWVVWKAIGTDKRKVPFDPKTAQPAKAGDVETWGSFEQAQERFKSGGYTGLGFEFHHDDDFIGIDLDGCRDPSSGKVETWAKDVIKSIGSYAEVSPSQTGVKIFASGVSPWERGMKRDLAYQNVVEEKNPGIEVYDRQRYFAVTGQRLRGCDSIVAIEPDKLRSLIDGLKAKQKTAKHDRISVVERAERYLEKCDPAISGSSGHDTTFKTACSLILGFCLTPEEAFPVFQNWNSRCDPPWSDKDLLRKLHEANKQSGERGYLRDSQLPGVPTPTHQQPHSKSQQSQKAPSQNEAKTDAVTLEKACVDYLAKIDGNEEELDSTGLGSLDHAIGGGLARGELCLVAARPSHGKSMFALQMLHSMSHKAPALIISEEMTATSLGKRTIQFASGVHQEWWFKDTAKVMQDVNSHFASRNPVFVVESTRTAERAAETIRHYKQAEGIEFCAVDYVQLLSSGNQRDRYSTVTQSSIILKQVAAETGVTLIVLAQLNRNLEKRETVQPRMSDLKESGQLEQDADVVMFLVWNYMMNADEPRKNYQVFVAKNRNRGIVKPAVLCEIHPGRQSIKEQPIEEDENYNEHLGRFSGQDAASSGF